MPPAEEVEMDEEPDQSEVAEWDYQYKLATAWRAD